MTTIKKISANSLKNSVIGADKVTKQKDGTFKFYRTFFYTNGKTSGDFAADIIEQLMNQFGIDNVKCLEHGEVWKSYFERDSSFKNQSHWFVVVSIAN